MNANATKIAASLTDPTTKTTAATKCIYCGEHDSRRKSRPSSGVWRLSAVGGPKIMNPRTRRLRRARRGALLLRAIRAEAVRLLPRTYDEVVAHARTTTDGPAQRVERAS